MTPTQILHTVYLCIIAGIVILGVILAGWWHHDAVLEGIAKCQKQSAEAAANQHIQDAKASQDAIDGLNQDIQHLRDQVNNPPIIHICSGVHHVDHPLPAGTSPPGAASGEPADRGTDRGVPAGSGGGDVGQGVRDVALAGELDALYYYRLYKWATETR